MNRKNVGPRKENHCRFLLRLRCNWQDHVIKNITRVTPTDVQKSTNPLGMELGNNPDIRPKQGQAYEQSMIRRHKDACKIQADNIPCPNLIHIRSSIMQIARDSQQNAPTFFTGFLKIIASICMINNCLKLVDVTNLSFMFVFK